MRCNNVVMPARSIPGRGVVGTKALGREKAVRLEWNERIIPRLLV